MAWSSSCSEMNLWPAPLKQELCYLAEQSQCAWTSFLLEGSKQGASLEVWHQTCPSPSHLDHSQNGWLTFYVCCDRKIDCIEQGLDWKCSRGAFCQVVLWFCRKHQDCTQCHYKHYGTNWFDLLLLLQIIF